jgi:tetratricopeptide (TPR) repeat protein
MNLGRFGDAIRGFRRILVLTPGDMDVVESLGVAYARSGRYEQAKKTLQKLLRMSPDRLQTMLGLANVHLALGELESAKELLMSVVSRVPDSEDAQCSLAFVETKQGKFEQAQERFERLLEARPDEPVYLGHLEKVLFSQKKWDELRALCQARFDRQPTSRESVFRLAKAMARASDLDGALALLQPFESIAETDAEVLGVFFDVYRYANRLPEAVSYFERSTKLPMSMDNIGSAGVLESLYLPARDESVLFAQARRYAESLVPEESLLAPVPQRNNQRLRLGFVSGDFRNHSVAYFLEPVLEFIDQERFEIFAYDNYPTKDEVSGRLREFFGNWRNIDQLPREAVRELVIEDGIDILVDLSGYTLGDRMDVFACRCAPVQVTWLGYPATTGLKTIDYRITDHDSDPEGLADRWYTETLWRLPEVFSVYTPPKLEVALQEEPPSIANGYVTFGSFNDYKKLNQDVLLLWARLLHEVPNARLLLKTRALEQARVREEVWDFFAGQGIGRDRVSLMARAESLGEHLALYNMIDIALDPFPYSGTTTTCEALWMGVPVVTLVGDVHRTRVGYSQLKSLGLNRLVAKNKDEYLRIALRLAADTEDMRHLRTGMRARMKQSPLMDAPRFVRHFEEAMERMYKESLPACS